MTGKRAMAGKLLSFSATNEDGGGWVVETTREDDDVLYARSKSAFSTRLEMQTRMEALLAESKAEMCIEALIAEHKEEGADGS